MSRLRGVTDVACVEMDSRTKSNESDVEVGGGEQKCGRPVLEAWRGVGAIFVVWIGVGMPGGVWGAEKNVEMGATWRSGGRAGEVEMDPREKLFLKNVSPRPSIIRLIYRGRGNLAAETKK